MYSESWQVQYDYLKTLLEGGVGSMLPGVNAVEEVSPPAGTNYPLLGVQYSHTDETPGEAMGYVTQVNYFDVTIVFARDFDQLAGQDVARELKLQAENALNDRAGHGLLVLLRQNQTLGGAAEWGGPRQIGVTIGRDPKDEARMSALVAVTVIAAAELRPM